MRGLREKRHRTLDGSGGVEKAEGVREILCVHAHVTTCY